MKHLKEIAKIVTKKKVKKIEIFDDHSLKVKSSKFNEYYEALMNGQFRDDKDAADYLYGCSPTDDKYRQLKSRFRKRLLNTLFFLDVNLPATSGYDRAYYSVNKDWTLVKILLSNKAYETAASLSKQILNVALKFKFADVIVNSSRILRDYASMVGDEKDYEIYDQNCKQYANVLDAEIRSEELYQRVVMNYYKPASKNTDLKVRIDTYCEALLGLSEVYESPVVIFNMYLVWAYRYEMLNDYENMLDTCGKADAYIRENPEYYKNDTVITIRLKQLTAYLHLKDFEKGGALALSCLDQFKQGTDTWFKFLEYYFLISLHTEHYQEAGDALVKAITHARFKRLDENDLERWKMFEVYLNIALKLQGIEIKGMRSFRMNKFITEVKLFPKELRIYTVWTYIGQAILLILEKNFYPAVDKIEMLKDLANRQLKKEEHLRVVQFIKLLQQLRKANFHTADLSNVEKYSDRLQEIPFKYRGLDVELEFILYGSFWNMLLKFLDEQK